MFKDILRNIFRKKFDAQGWVDRAIRDVDIEKELLWAQEYVETYHLEDPFESSFIAHCLDQKSEKVVKVQQVTPLGGESMYKLGSDLVLSGKLPFLYVACSEMRVAEHDSEELPPDLDIAVLPECYFCVVNSMGGERHVVAVADVLRDPYGDKLGVGEWNEMRDGTLVEQEAAKFWAGAAHAFAIFSK